MTFESKIRPIEWAGDHVKLIDQTALPYEYTTVNIKTWQEMAVAIKDMIVRGAPAIGISGAFGVALGAREFLNSKNLDEFLQKLEMMAIYLKATRPTAVNLMWAVDKQVDYAKSLNLSMPEIVEKLEQNAVKMLNEDIEINKKIGEHGAKIVPKGGTILTHCNAGALATAGYGTALGVARSAYAKDPTIRVFADETRPRQQGARLTAWELVNDGIPTTLITDGMCGYFMKKGEIDVVVVGGDRVALNGDTANKIGTYTVALAAKAHNIPFYVAVPHSTIDASIETGDQIPIEERDAREVTHINGKLVCPEEVNIINPAFDVTPGEYITGIITETGIYKPSELKQAINAIPVS
ncbi:MAG TPA: S-methyl-5-thioribose-1-phosphate isomerase [Candidatus Gastranaerophilales bacterium]|nr:S-methyl-5-thioribose-1-phosphate isomerase [Candidatus Gastranaerophilales bacterium]